RLSPTACATSLLVGCPLAASRVLPFHHPPTTRLYPLSLHDALPISDQRAAAPGCAGGAHRGRQPRARLSRACPGAPGVVDLDERSEEHTSELQSRFDLVCRLLLEKKKTPRTTALTFAGDREAARTQM